MFDKAKCLGILTISSLITAKAAMAADGWQLPDNDFGLPDKDFSELIIAIIDWLLEFVSLLAIVVIIYGGLVYVASTGDQDRVNQAKKAVKYAIMGLAMAGLSYAAVNLVVSTVIK